MKAEEEEEAVVPCDVVGGGRWAARCEKKKTWSRKVVGAEQSRATDVNVFEAGQVKPEQSGR